MAPKPSRMFELLRECGALQRLLPEVAALWGVPQRAEHHPEVDTGVHLMMVLDMAARLQAPLPVRFACLGHDLGKGTSDPRFLPRHHGHEERSAALLQQLCERLRVPIECRDLADVVAREHGHVHASAGLGAAALVRLFERCDALRRPERFKLLLQACECDARGRGGREETDYAPARRLPPLLQVARGVDTAAVAALAVQRGRQGPEIGAAVHRARVAAVAAALEQAPSGEREPADRGDQREGPDPGESLPR